MGALGSLGAPLHCGGLQLWGLNTPLPVGGFNQLHCGDFNSGGLLFARTLYTLIRTVPYFSLSGVTTSMDPPTAHQEHKLNQVTTDQVGKMWFRVEVICGVVRVAWPGQAWYLAPGVPGDTWYQVHQGGQVARVK